MEDSAFIICQIGNKQIDKVCEKSIVPAIESVGLEARRVDKHNEGELLKSKIVDFIEESPIIIADLTNSRPNCYLEVGYAMGLDKFRNLILTVRDDHMVSSGNYKSGGGKVHFDLSGYDILSWNEDNLGEFKEELGKRIKRRLAIITTKEESEKDISEEWIKENRDHSQEIINKRNIKGILEVIFYLKDHELNIKQNDLLDAAKHARIRTFGWPLGVILENRKGAGAKPTTDGIKVEADIDRSYDYWKLKRNGDFYLIKDIFEDQNSNSDKLFFDTRIIRVTEAFLYCRRLYDQLGVPSNKTVSIRVRHAGLKDRVLSVASRRRIMHEVETSGEDEITTQIEFKLSEVDSRLPELVAEVIDPLFNLFDFFEIDRNVLEDIVEKYVDGQIV